MRALIDSSVILRLLFSEPRPLQEWSRLRVGYASRLLPVEVGRVIDRVRLAGRIDDTQVEDLHQETRRVLGSLTVVEMSESILRLAARAMPTALGTLDAIHLATTLELSRHLDDPLVLATHDVQLARAARASGLEVVGV